MCRIINLIVSGVVLVSCGGGSPGSGNWTREGYEKFGASFAESIRTGEFEKAYQQTSPYFRSRQNLDAFQRQCRSLVAEYGAIVRTTSALNSDDPVMLKEPELLTGITGVDPEKIRARLWLSFFQENGGCFECAILIMDEEGKMGISGWECESCGAG